MDQDHKDELTMLTDLQTFFTIPANLAKITPITDLLAGKVELDGHNTYILAQNAITIADTTGVAKNKSQQRQVVTDLILDIAGPLVALGRKTSNNDLIEQFNVTPSELGVMDGHTLTNFSGTVAATATTNMLALAGTGVTVGMVTDLNTETATFLALINTPEQARQAKKVANQNIKERFPVTRTLIDQTLDPLMRTNFAKTDKDFYRNYIANTEIINTGIHHLDFFGVLLDDSDGHKLHGALLRVLQGNIQIQETKTGNKGHFRFKELPEGEYTVEISRPGYVTKTVSNIVIIKGESLKKVFSLVPNP